MTELAMKFLELKDQGYIISEIQDILKIDRLQLCLIYNEINPKQTINEYQETWRNNNREKLKIYNKKYQLKNKDNIKRWRQNKSNSLRIKIYTFTGRKFKPKTNMKKSNISTRRKLQKKIGTFSADINKVQKQMFTVDQLLEKIGDVPRCYLTGRLIDLNKSETYHLDHIIPTSKGGDNSLENCNITCKEANIAKNNLSVEEFYNLCLDVVNNKVYNPS